MIEHGEQRPEAPDWDGLFDVAQSQAGYFTTQQAAQSGYSPQLLSYLAGKKVSRVQRGIYRLIHFPASEHEELVVLWLWSDQAGVFSHQTALALHDLSDVLPGKVHLSLPEDWRRRRLRIPAGLILHYADVGEVDRESLAAVPVTSPLRTVADCIEANVSPDMVRQAIGQARGRGLISAADEARLRELQGENGAVPR